jgi:hypothetical protein
MTTFTDSTGTLRTVTMTVGAAIRIKAKHGVDLLRIESDGVLEAFSRMTLDLEKQAQIIVEMMGLSETEMADFVSGLDGATVAASQTAFFDELESFFRQSGQTAKARIIGNNRLILAKANEIQGQAVDRAAQSAVLSMTSTGGTYGNAPDASA